MATPIDAATRRLGSLVDDSAMTAKTTWPGFMSDRPSSRSTSSQCGGEIELTRTRLKFARWASRSAISKLVSFSLCRPTPLVRKALVGTNIRESINRSPPGQPSYHVAGPIATGGAGAPARPGGRTGGRTPATPPRSHYTPLFRSVGTNIRESINRSPPGQPSYHVAGPIATGGSGSPERSGDRSEEDPAELHAR